MVLILQGSVSDPRVEMMLKCIRQKNDKYDMRLEEIVVKYKNDVDKEPETNKTQETHVKKVREWKQQ